MKLIAYKYDKKKKKYVACALAVMEIVTSSEGNNKAEK